MTTAEQFWAVFRGRDDLYAVNGPQGPDGKVPCYPVREPVTMEVIDRHLNGDQPIGVYPLVHYRGQSWVGWGCSDIDVDDPDLAWTLHDVLNEAAITSWVERSRSKGFHVWVFVQEPISAVVMRNALLMAHKVAGIAATEVNPKRTDSGTRKELGNLVRLPYPNGYEENWRQVILAARTSDISDGALWHEQFLREPVFANPDAIRRAASLWQEPVKQAQPVSTVAPQDAFTAAPPLVKHIWRHGPSEGHDRSSTMARMAHECANAGMSPSQAFALLKSWGWNKFLDRPDEIEQIQRLVDNAYS